MASDMSTTLICLQQDGVEVMQLKDKTQSSDVPGGAARSPQQLGPLNVKLHHGGAAAVTEAALSQLESEMAVELGRRLTKTLESLRQHVPTGSGDRFPVIDPLHATALPPLNLTCLGLVRIGLSLSNVDVTGLRNFTVNGMEVHLKAHRIDFDLNFESLKLCADYCMHATLLNKLAYKPEGQIVAVTGALRARGSAGFGIVAGVCDKGSKCGSHRSHDNHFALTSFHMDLDFDSIELSMTGLTPNCAVNSALNRLANLMSDVAFDAMCTQLTRYASRLIVERVNSLLTNCSAV